MSTTENYTERIEKGARLAFDCAEEMKANDIDHYIMTEEPKFADHVIVLTIHSPRQMRAVSEEIKNSLKKIQLPLHHEEGDRNSGWGLLDYGDLIIHMFAGEFREFYAIESILINKGDRIRFMANDTIQ